MSAKPAAKSKGEQSKLDRHLAQAPRVARARAAATVAVEPTPEEPAPAAPAIVASAIALVPFRRLKRAPENVRHIRKDEDVQPLADDIAAHGLLQSLIGYRALDEDHKTPVERIWIVAGGRRLQALGVLVDRDAIGIDFEVPVLIRPREEAIELSLSENLQKRDMSPVDECRAFKALMDLGTHSPDELGRRFGFTERYVKQRLRLADLAPPVLDALAEKKISLPAAMAYAASTDADLQLQVFKQQEKSTWDKHAVQRIKADYSAAQLTTGSPVFKFVGAETYERDGGLYEDDLFAEDATAQGGRKIASGPILAAAARRMLEFQGIRVQAEAGRDHPSVAGVVVAPNLRIDSYPWPAPKAPAGLALVETDYYDNDRAKIWRRIDQHAVPVHLIVGVNAAGEIAAHREKLFVAKDQLDKVKVKSASSGSSYTPPSPEETARRERERMIDENAWRLGVGSFKGTPFEGRAFWPRWSARPIDKSEDPAKQAGRMVAVQIYVTEEQYNAHLAEAERMADEQIELRKAEVDAKTKAQEEHPARVAEILAIEPAPEVVTIDGAAWYRTDGGGWVEDPDDVVDEQPAFHSLENLLSVQPERGDPLIAYATIGAYQAAIAAAAAEVSHV